jgi:hypothetical protein
MSTEFRVEMNRSLESALKYGLPGVSEMASKYSGADRPSTRNPVHGSVRGFERWRREAAAGDAYVLTYQLMVRDIAFYFASLSLSFVCKRDETLITKLLDGTRYSDLSELSPLQYSTLVREHFGPDLLDQGCAMFEDIFWRLAYQRALLVDTP